MKISQQATNPPSYLFQHSYISAQLQSCTGFISDLIQVCVSEARRSGAYITLEKFGKSRFYNLANKTETFLFFSKG